MRGILDHSVPPRLPPRARHRADEVRTLAEVYRDQRFGDNLGAITIAAVSGSVPLLSAAGLYALMAFTVAQRRRETLRSE
jgi:hypothetical protein